MKKEVDITAVFELAGWCAAEALLNLSHHYKTKLAPGEAALLPSLVVENPSKKRLITVFDTVSREKFQEIAVLLDRLSPSDKYAVLTSDGYITIDNKKVNSVSLEGNLLVHPRQSFCLVVPYEHPDGDRPLAFDKPKIASYDGFDVDSIDIGEAFSRGRNSHPSGAAIWQKHFRPGELS